MPSLQPEVGKNRVFVVDAIFFDRDLGDHIVCLDVVMSFLLFACVWLEGRCISRSIQPDISYAQNGNSIIRSILYGYFILSMN